MCKLIAILVALLETFNVAGTSVIYDDQQLRDLIQDADRLGVIDNEAARWNVAGLLESAARGRISAGGPAPDGKPWPEWKNSDYGPKHPGHKLLQLEGDLADDIQGFVQPDGAGAGVTLVYGATHQFGDPARGILQREFLGVSDTEFSQIVDLLQDWYETAVKGALSA